jgi:hypothetical protein
MQTSKLFHKNQKIKKKIKKKEKEKEKEKKKKPVITCILRENSTHVTMQSQTPRQT